MTDQRRRTRRAVLRSLGALGATGLAGCLGGETATQSEIPVTGTASPALGAFDDTVRSFMAEHDIPGAVLGVARDGAVLLERGYGYRDREQREETTPDTLFRIASLSKAFTRAAVRTLLREGHLQSTQRAFPTLGYDPLPGDSYNERIDEITVGDLLRHQGGWDREATMDPLFVQIEIALEHDWEEPPSERDIIRYMLSEPLQFAPGTNRAYSNFGYLVAGHLVEAVTGTSYQRYLDENLLEPHGIGDIALGRSLPARRPARESWYFDRMACRNVAEMQPLELVPCPDGGFHQEAISAAGGHIATAGAMLSFMQAYWLDGRPRTGTVPQRWVYNGTLPGAFSTAIQYRGVDIVVMFNQRGYDPNYQAIASELIDTLVGIDEWPEPR